ncbi:hypothetical protein QJS10_CPA07g00611 [Acorus calamus]|uniref:Uncharacterized protein n=1 Tax=Acorus calamus TaxID=4465 RepID=A0AAV9EE69_ACOCL|nr:hypothetical protein QJS10_CPA07g00611 [Acorus calamus]
MFGLTLLYHRNLSHSSFHLPKWLEYAFAYCGSQALQGDPIMWVSTHRYHHQYCDWFSGFGSATWVDGGSVIRRGMAEQPPCVRVFGTPWPRVVAD